MHEREALDASLAFEYHSEIVNGRRGEQHLLHHEVVKAQRVQFQMRAVVVVLRLVPQRLVQALDLKGYSVGSHAVKGRGCSVAEAAHETFLL